MKPKQCPWCHGRGGYVDVIVDGQGPLEPCGICGGTGEIKSKRLFYQALAWLPRKAAKKWGPEIIKRSEFIKPEGPFADDDLWK